MTLPIVYRLQRVTHSHDAVWLPAQRQRKKASALSSLRKSPELARGKEWPSFASLSPAWEHHLGSPLAAQHKLSWRSLGPLPPLGNSSSSSRAHSPNRAERRRRRPPSCSARRCTALATAARSGAPSWPARARRCQASSARSRRVEAPPEPSVEAAAVAVLCPAPSLPLRSASSLLPSSAPLSPPLQPQQANAEHYKLARVAKEVLATVPSPSCKVRSVAFDLAVTGAATWASSSTTPALRDGLCVVGDD